MKIVNAISGQHEDKVHYKVLKALLDVDVNDEEKVNLSYLVDVPVKCLPRVLEWCRNIWPLMKALGSWVCAPTLPASSESHVQRTKQWVGCFMCYEAFLHYLNMV